MANAFEGYILPLIQMAAAGKGIYRQRQEEEERRRREEEERKRLYQQQIDTGKWIAKLAPVKKMGFQEASRRDIIKQLAEADMTPKPGMVKRLHEAQYARLASGVSTSPFLQRLLMQEAKPKQVVKQVQRTEKALQEYTNRRKEFEKKEAKFREQLNFDPDMSESVKRTEIKKLEEAAGKTLSWARKLGDAQVIQESEEKLRNLQRYYRGMATSPESRFFNNAIAAPAPKPPVTDFLKGWSK